MLLERTAKLMISAGEWFKVPDFTRKVLRDVAFDKTTAKTFEHLKTSAMLWNAPIAEFVEIYEAKLMCSAFSKDEGTWIEYHGYLVANHRQLDAKRVLERAIEACNDKQSILACCKQ